MAGVPGVPVELVKVSMLLFKALLSPTLLLNKKRFIQLLYRSDRSYDLIDEPVLHSTKVRGGRGALTGVLRSKSITSSDNRVWLAPPTL